MISSFSRKGEDESRLTAEEMDEIRQKNLAYAYLCHLEEAKIWLENMLREELPPTTELEENLRNGIYLARLGHVIAPEVVPVSKIYDIEQRRYNAAGLQFRHTDNINYWLKSLVAIELPKTFQPETTDVYDKKNMPRVIYCIHALSTHLFKLGRAPLIQDLYGKLNFTDDEINSTRLELEKYGIELPAFQKIGGILSNDTHGDSSVLHTAILTINDAIENEDLSSLMEALKNPSAMLQHVVEQNSSIYLKNLLKAKLLKSEACHNKSLNESYEADIYDDLLTQAEIQGHIVAVNVQADLEHVLNSVHQNDPEKLAVALSSSYLNLKNVRKENSKCYLREFENIPPFNTSMFEGDWRESLQLLIIQGNCKAWEQESEASAVKAVNDALESSSVEKLMLALKSASLKLSGVSDFAAPLYFEEMKTDRIDSKKDLTYSDICASIKILTDIAAVTHSVDVGNCDLTWDALSNPETHFMDLDQNLKMKYWFALTSCRQQKMIENYDCSLLTYIDIQDCIDLVNQQFDDKSHIIEVLQQLNDAVKNGDSFAVLSAIQNPLFKLTGSITPAFAPVYLQLLQAKLNDKGDKDGELWLEDVQSVVLEAEEEASDAISACKMLAVVNESVEQNNSDILMMALQACNLFTSTTERINNKLFTALREYRRKKESKYDCPWVMHTTKRNIVLYINVEDCDYSWHKPKEFSSGSPYLNAKDIKNIVNYVKTVCNSKMTERFIIHLQARIRGCLIRKSLNRRKYYYFCARDAAVKIQAWWKGILERRRYRTLLYGDNLHSDLGNSDGVLKKYHNEQKKIIKVQALWRGRKARHAFVSLFHQPTPSLGVVKHFIHLLDFNADDYQKDLQLQSLKGQVVQAIRHNQKLSKRLDEMDLKIGLLVHNRITLQDVVAHGTTLNDLAKRKVSSSSIDQSDPSTDTLSKGLKLKSLTKEGHKLLEGYQHLFYTLQTNPKYLAKIILCLPQSRSTRFLQTVIFTLFNFGSNSREEYLLLKLFRTALQEEISYKYQKLSEVMLGNPLVLRLVVNYSRQTVGQNSVQQIVGPLVEEILTSKDISINTNPVDIYKWWRNQTEHETGKVIDLPHSVTVEEALKHPEVRQCFNDGIKLLRNWSLKFLNRITNCSEYIPYGLRYIAKVLKDSLAERFPNSQEKDILKVVGNLIYYHYINSAIVAPDAFDIVNVSRGSHLSNEHRRTLASIAKILQFAATKKGFGEESSHLMTLNTFIVECHEKFKKFFLDVCNVDELESHFSMNEFSEAMLLSRPLIYISLQEICDTHKLLLQYQDQLATDPMDPLCELLEELGTEPSLTTLLGTTPDPAALTKIASMEVCLSLVNKFEVPEDDDTNINKLFIKAKELLVFLLPFLHGCNLLEALKAGETETELQTYEDSQTQRYEEKCKHLDFTENGSDLKSLCGYKKELQIYLSRLELNGLVSHEDGYQTIVTAIAQDICNKGYFRQMRTKEMEMLHAAKKNLECKTKFYEEQVDYYNQYIQKCLENLNAGKKSIHCLKYSNKHPGKIKSKMTLKYTAARLNEKGVLMNLDELPKAQWKSVLFEISPTENNGVFTVKARFMGVEMEKVDIDIQSLLQLQYEGVSIMKIFDSATVNVNLLLFLLNSKFYGK